MTNKSKSLNWLKLLRRKEKRRKHHRHTSHSLKQISYWTGAKQYFVASLLLILIVNNKNITLVKNVPEFQLCSFIFSIKLKLDCGCEFTCPRAVSSS